MIVRRQFIKSSLGYGLSLCSLPLFSTTNKDHYRIRLDVAARLFDGQYCWAHPRAGIIPEVGRDGKPLVVMTMNKLDLAGSDVFKDMYGLHTSDLSTWTPPRLMRQLAPGYEIIEGVKRPVALSDFWPSYHSRSGRLLGIGHTVVYTPDWKVKSPRPRHTAYAVYNEKDGHWNPWRKLEMSEDRFYNAGAGSVQRYDDHDGSILLPIHYNPPSGNARVVVLRCSFDGEQIQVLDIGNDIGVEGTRGLHEPSVIKYRSRYYLTIRNDQTGYVAVSSDGLHYGKIQQWTFDDGTNLGNYNTQQHWVRHSKGLFLVYTRRGADNDHVFRHRAPLFMAEVDTDRLCVIRSSERIMVPERGARLGNFGVTEVGPDETWITVSEWMQPKGVEKYGSDGSVFIARIQWNTPNLLFGK